MSYTTTSLDGVLATDNIETAQQVIDAIASEGSISTGTVSVSSSVNTDKITIAGDAINSIGATTNDIKITNSASGAVKIDNIMTLKGNTIGSLSNNDVVITPNGTGALKTDNLQFDGNTVSVTDTNGNLNLNANSSGKVIVDNDLAIDRNGFTQTANSDIYLTTTSGKVRVDSLSLDAATLKAEVGDLTLTCDDTTNKVYIGSLPFKLNQTVGSGNNNHVLTYDNSTNSISLQASSGGGGGSSPWTTSGSNIYYDSGNVGVGVSSSTVNSQLMVKDTGASHTAVQVTAGTSQNCSVKLSRGAGDWSSAGNETIGMHLDTNSLLFSKLTAPGNNLTGFSGDVFRIDIQNYKCGIATYPYAPSTSLTIGSVLSVRAKESVLISSKASGAEQSLETGIDATSAFIQSNNSTNQPKELQIRQGTNGNVMVIDSAGDVGINNSTPNAKFNITTTTGKRALEISGDSGSSSSQVYLSGSTFGIAMAMNNTSASNYALSITNGIANIFSLKNNGALGMGTTSPHARIHINGFGGSSSSASFGARRYFRSTSAITGNNGTWSMTQASLYALGDIIGSSWIVSLQSTSFSDRRMKENIVDVDDDQCLQKLRLLKPKQYTYKDTHKRGTAPVWGFIAQEVKETLDYAVNLMEKELPNIYKLASVSNDGKTLTFSENIILQDDEPRLMLKTWKNTEVRAVIVSHTDNTITLGEPLEQNDITCDEFTNEIFVYGQIVSDFHHLQKDAIFTVAVSALQEVDRQQQLHKNKIATLEARMALLEQRLNNAGL